MEVDKVDLIEILAIDHKHIRDQSKDLKTCSGRENRKRSLRELLRAIYAHTRAEELTLYSELKDQYNFRPLVLTGYEDHHLISTLGQELEGMDVEGERWLSKCEVLFDFIEDHFLEEESSLFRDSREVISETRLVDLGKKYQKLKDNLSRNYEVSRYARRIEPFAHV